MKLDSSLQKLAEKAVMIAALFVDKVPKNTLDRSGDAVLSWMWVGDQQTGERRRSALSPTIDPDSQGLVLVEQYFVCNFCAGDARDGGEKLHTKSSAYRSHIM
jgi:hypothetical protein